MTDSNHDLVRTFFRALGAGTLSDDLFTSDMTVWTVSSGSADMGRFLGGARLLASIFNGTLVYTINSLTAEDDRVAVEAQSHGTLINGEPYHNTHMYLLRIRDGRIAAISEFMNQTLIKDKVVPLMQQVMTKRQS